MTKTINTYKTCQKCSGMGRIASFAHVSNGACFRCSGEGKIKTGEKIVEVKEIEKTEYVSDEEIEKLSNEFDYSTLG